MRTITMLILILWCFGTNPAHSQQKIQKDEMTAMIFSAFTPGLGQFYAHRYWRGAGFFILEMAAIGTFTALTERQKKITIEDMNGNEHRITVKKNRWKNLSHGEKTAVIASGLSAVGIYVWQILDARKCVREHNRKMGYEVGFGFTPDGNPGVAFQYRF